MALTPQEFQTIAEFLKTRSGLSIGYEKVYLLENRLQPILREHDLPTLNALSAHLRRGVLSQDLIAAIVEAMTTNESMFFRDQKPFRQLRDIVLPDLINKLGGELRIWSAACSYGQEPYSVAMVLQDEAAKLEGTRVNILATDIAENVLERARRGMYTQFEVQRGLPITHLMKYFSQRSNNQWQINETTRAMVRFAPGNLLASFKELGSFDMVMCRNVLIYFDEATKTEILERMADIIHLHGYLFLGSSETILASTKFAAVEGCPGLFRRA